MTAARIAVVIAAFCAMSHAHAQRATERYIPLGQSPGVSQKLTWIGEIADADESKRTVTIVEPAGRRTVGITEKTRIWLDRTKLKQPNLAGSFADLQKGRRVEVKLQAPESQGRRVADWVKVEIARP
jgi:hypothetical protein